MCGFEQAAVQELAFDHGQLLGAQGTAIGGEVLLHGGAHVDHLIHGGGGGEGAEQLVVEDGEVALDGFE